MSEKLEQKALDIIDGLGANLGAMQEKLTELAMQHGDQAIDMLLALVRIGVAQSILIGLLFLIPLIWVKYPARQFVLAKEIKKAKDERYSRNEEMSAEVRGLLSLIFIVGASITAVVKLSHIWNWVGLFYPELYLAHKALDKVIN